MVIVLCLFSLSIVLFTKTGFSTLPPKVIDFEHFSTKDGLPDMVVYDIVQDGKGYLWFSTSNGISRYDGYQFRNYQNDEKDPFSIGRGPVVNLFIDDQDRLWVAILGSGLFRFDESNDNFVYFKHDPQDPNSISSNSPYGLAQDEMGRLWITTIDAGVNRYDEVNNRFIRYRHDPDNPNSLAGDRSFSVFRDSTGDLWIDSTGKSLNRYNIREKKWTHYLKGLSQANTFLEDQYGDLWVSTFGRGVVRFNRNRSKITTYQHDESDPYSLAHNQVIDIMEDDRGTIWFSTWGGGLSVYDRENDRFIRYRSDPSNPFSLNTDDLWKIFQDRTGVIWIGTYGAGINKYDRKTERFPRMRANIADPNSLSHNNVKSVFQDSRGDLWIGTLGGGLNKYHSKQKTFTHFRHDPALSGSLSNDYVWKIVEDRSGTIWVATVNGLNKYLPQSNSFKRYQREPGNPKSLRDNVIRTMIVDRNGALWLGLQIGGIARHIRDNDSFAYYPIGTVHNNVMFEDSTGSLWVGNPQGLFRFDRQKDVFVRVTSEPDNPEIFFNEFVTVITEDRKGNLWVGRNNGLTRVEPDTGKLEDYSERSRLVNQDITGIIAEDSGRLWISTSSSLTVFNPESNRRRSYDLGTFNRGAFEQGEDGKLYFGSTKGLLHFFADGITDNLLPPPVVLTSIKKFDHEIVLDRPLSELTELTFSHTDRFFSLEFSALDFSDPSKNRYRYKLEGFDSDWREVGSDRRIATYTNLDGGDYLFRVTGSNNDGIWSDTYTELKITITPPFWKTWWWFTLCVLVIVGTFGLVYWNKSSQLRKVRSIAKALTESEEKYRNVVDNATEAICVLQDKRFIFFNPEAVRLFGFPEKRLYQMPLEAVIHPQDKTEIETMYQNQLQSGGVLSHSLRVVTEKDHTLWVDIKAVTIKWENQPAVLVFLTDITEQKRSVELLIQTEKMMSLGGMAAGMAHELNNPLGGILLGVQNIQRRLSSSFKKNHKIADELGVNLEKFQIYLEKRGIHSQLIGIQESGAKASSIIANMLQFSRSSDSQQAPRDLTLLMNKTLELAENDYNLKKRIDFRQIRIEKDYQENMPPVPCSETEIEQVALNLLQNAARAMAGNGYKRPPKISIRIRLEEKAARVEVEDNGPGMDEETRNKIFEPFFTTKPVGEGTGLGLSVSYMIITNNHKGTLEVESEPNRGTKFIIRLPLDRDIGL